MKNTAEHFDWGDIPAHLIDSDKIASPLSERVLHDIVFAFRDRAMDMAIENMTDEDWEAFFNKQQGQGEAKGFIEMLEELKH